MRALLTLLLCASSWSCVSFTWERDSRYAPIAAESLAQLRPGETELDTCLRAFGAPLWVWEHPAGQLGAGVLAYGWFEERDLGLRVTVPVSERFTGRFDYDDIDARMRGLVLFFDPHWKLTSWQTGLLRDLSREVRRRPTSVEDEG